VGAVSAVSQPPRGARALEFVGLPAATEFPWGRKIKTARSGEISDMSSLTLPTILILLEFALFNFGGELNRSNEAIE
jgi:ABC-type dipeptide/oligopeptide/nickel transport system permease subunit